MALSELSEKQVSKKALESLSRCFHIPNTPTPMHLGPTRFATKTASTCSPRRRWTCSDILFIIGLALLHQVAAQTPVTSFGASQVVVQGKAMIISGGISTSQGVLSQTFAIDLSVSWDASSPKYSMLANGPADLYVPFGQAADGSAIVISRGQSFSFNLNSSSGWILTGNLPNGINAAMTRLTGAIDPVTNIFYMPGGFRVAGANDTMMQYSIAQGTAASLPMPPTLPLYAESTAVWSSYAKRLFLHGGRSPTDYIPLGDLYSFNPADNTWSKPVPGGDTPPKRYNHCMASDATGKRLVVFGGFDNVVVPAFSDIYILNVETMQWTKGPDAGNATARAAPSCGIDNDLFIVWGGGYNSVTVTKNITLLFNLQTMQWVNQFTPTASLGTPSSGAQPTTPSNTSTKPSSTGAIIGGVVGGLAAGAIVVGLTVCRRRRKQKPPVSSQKEEVTEVHYHPPGYVAPPSLPPPDSQQQPSSTTVHKVLKLPQYHGTPLSDENINPPSRYLNANPEYYPLPKGSVGVSAPTIGTSFLPQFRPDPPQLNGPHTTAP
ncbi:hypothetical protein CPC16_000147 [Podila verticillata]|nr:hypothetical protein CPC16_000147 [Podila verticillata]